MNCGPGRVSEDPEAKWLTMAPHSSTLAWKIPWMEEPGRLQSMGSLRVDGYCPRLAQFRISQVCGSRGIYILKSSLGDQLGLQQPDHWI